MSEVTFAKSFLTTLDRRPIKLPSDHVSDPRQYPGQSPLILPKQTHPFPRKQPADGAQAVTSKTITATIKPMRSGETVTLSGISLNDSVHDIKAQYAQKTSQSLEKIKLLLNKKPAADLKTLKDLGVDKDVELSAMILGQTSTSEQTPTAEHAAASPAAPTAPKEQQTEQKTELDSQASHPGSEKAQAEADKVSAGASAGGPSGPGALNTAEFWSDLEDFLSQRLRDTAEAGKVVGVFKKAWVNQ